MCPNDHMIYNPLIELKNTGQKIVHSENSILRLYVLIICHFIVIIESIGFDCIKIEEIMIYLYNNS